MKTIDQFTFKEIVENPHYYVTYVSYSYTEKDYLENIENLFRRYFRNFEFMTNWCYNQALFASIMYEINKKHVVPLLDKLKNPNTIDSVLNEYCVLRIAHAHSNEYELVIKREYKTEKHELDVISSIFSDYDIAKKLSQELFTCYFSYVKYYEEYCGLVYDQNILQTVKDVYDKINFKTLYV